MESKKQVSAKQATLDFLYSCRDGDQRSIQTLNVAKIRAHILESEDDQVHLSFPFLSPLSSLLSPLSSLLSNLSSLSLSLSSSTSSSFVIRCILYIQGNNCFHYVAASDRPGMVDFLLSFLEDEQNKHLWTQRLVQFNKDKLAPVHIAIALNYVAMVRVLALHGMYIYMHL